jgi:MYXO-CTERM domain-containing protein
MATPLLVLFLASGSVQALVTPNPTVDDLLVGVSREVLEPVVLDLSGERATSVGGSAYSFTTRSSSSGEPIDMAEQYAYEALQRCGLDSVVYHAFPAESGAPAGRNVIGQIDGTTRRDEIVVVGAHLDNRPWSGRAPGADDNASGVSATLLLACALAEQRLERTVRFAIFGDEENAPWVCEEIGSVGYAARCRDEDEDIVAMIAADAIAFDPPESEDRIVELNIRPQDRDPAGDDRALAALWLDVIEAYAIDDITPVVIAAGNNWSDHGSFWKHGYPAALLVAEEQEHWNPNWHTPNDTIDTFSWSLYVPATRSLLALTAHLAGIEGSPVDSGGPDTGVGPGHEGCDCRTGSQGAISAALALIALGLAQGARRSRQGPIPPRRAPASPGRPGALQDRRSSLRVLRIRAPPGPRDASIHPSG